MTRKASTAMLVLFVAGAIAADEAEPEEPPVDDEVTDMEFLEYLGSWEESDTDWLIVSEALEDVPAANPPRSSDEENEREN